MVFSINLLVGGIVGCFLPKTDIVEEHQLCSLNEDEYLSSSYLDGKLVYQYSYETNIGKYTKTEKAENVSVVYGDYVPTVKIRERKLDKNWYVLFTHGYLANYREVEIILQKKSSL